MQSAEVAPHIESAKHFYLEGYFLTHGTDTAVELAKKATAAGKVFVLNFSAPFIPQFFSANLDQILPYCDIIIGNETEAEAWASAKGLAETKDLKAVGKAIAGLPKSNPARPRTVVLTHGAEATVVVTSDKPDSPSVFPVHALKPEQIVDTNAAGDAFAGGFLGALVAGKSTEEAVAAGQKLAALVIQEVSTCSFATCRMAAAARFFICAPIVSALLTCFILHLFL